MEEKHSEEQHNLFLIAVRLMKMMRTERMDEMRESFNRGK
jgi:hypothetical protein